MALSNRDRVGRGFELLASGLAPYVDLRLRATSRSGKDWLREFMSAASIRGDASLNDPSFLLKVIADTWERSFSSELSRTDRNLVFELRDVRNRWAHNDGFTVDDAYRALDTIERLLVSVDAREAIEVGRAKTELMYQKVEAQARKAAPSAEAMLKEPAAGLKPWRDVMQPHDDVVAPGAFSLAEFAADLHQVALGDARSEYGDPVEFFRRTFLTVGLRQLLSGAVKRLGGQEGSPVVDLQTSFGGGKTHSMIALYHLSCGLPLERFPQEVQDLVRESGAEALPVVRRAVLVGTRISASQPSVKPDGTEVRTLWGELAWQLGGTEAYALVAESDRRGTSPGDALQAVLKLAGPSLILIDEWVAYARELYHDDSLPGGSFDTHFTFAQLLTEAVRSSKQTLLVVSIPASSDAPGGPGSAGSPVSSIEVGGTGGRAALQRLRAVVGRLESSWRPASAEESFEIVRRRLFQHPDGPPLADRDVTARVLGDFYRAQANEFPVECREPAYAERIRQAYPLHPELFARLYEDWSTLDRFQRTRGVLRLMATVVRALWQSGDQSPIILPATIPLEQTDVAQELTRNLEDNWKPIMDAEVDGPSSLPVALDAQYKSLGRYLATRRVARAVFMGSAPLVGSPNQGLDAAHVRLGCALPGETVAIYGDALNRLAAQATYFYAENGRYWFGTQPGVARLARDRASRLLAGDRHEILDAVRERLEDLAARRPANSPFAGVHVCPAGPSAVRDEQSTRLVVLGPDTGHRSRGETSPALQLAGSILDEKGSGPRDYRNMLVFLAADEREVEDLFSTVADRIAWKSIVDESEQIGLSSSQHTQAWTRWDDAVKAVDTRLLESYQWLLVPRLDSPTGAAVSWIEAKLGGAGNLFERAGSKADSGGHVYSTYAPLLLRMKLDEELAPLWSDGSVAVGQLWDVYSRYLYLHRLRDIRVLTDCVAAGMASTSWETEGFGVAEATDGRSPGQLAGLVSAGSLAQSVKETWLVVEPAVASAQLAAAAETAAAGAGLVGDRGGEGSEAGGESGRIVPSVDGRELLKRFYGAAVLDPVRMGRDAGTLATEIVAHLAGLEGTDVEVTVEIRANNPAGFPEGVRKIVKENADALRLRESGFETE